MANDKNENAALVKWGEYTDEAVEQEIAAGEAERGSRFWKPRAGRNVIRVLPPQVGKSSPFRVSHQHKLDVPGVGQVYFICPRMEARLPCRVCSMAQQFAATGNPIDDEKAKNMRAKRTVFSRIVDRNEEDRGVQIYRFGQAVHDQLKMMRDPVAGLGIDFSHPITGRDVILIVAGKVSFDMYKLSADPKGASQLSDDATVMNDWLSQPVDLDRWCKPPTPEQMEEKLTGGKKTGRGFDGGGQQAKPQRGRTAADDIGG